MSLLLLRNHHAKTHGGWHCHLVPDPTGARTTAIEWTSPTGRTWIVRTPQLHDPLGGEDEIPARAAA